MYAVLLREGNVFVGRIFYTVLIIYLMRFAFEEQVKWQEDPEWVQYLQVFSVSISSCWSHSESLLHLWEKVESVALQQGVSVNLSRKGTFDLVFAAQRPLIEDGDFNIAVLLVLNVDDVLVASRLRLGDESFGLVECLFLEFNDYSGIDS